MSVHQEPPPQGKKTVPIQERLINNREPRDARNDINEHRCRKYGDVEEQRYNTHHGGCYDSEEDWITPDPLGPRVFSREFHIMSLLSPFRPPTNITEYNGETKPELWLADFWLACQLGGARGDD